MNRSCFSVRFLTGLAFGVLVLVLASPGAARADCPDKPVSCGALTMGWQGTCFKGLRGCKACGPRHCPKQLGLNDIKFRSVPGHPNGESCRQFVVNDILAKEGNGSACSSPDAVKKLFPLADQVFGRSACLEHDVCYRLPGVSRQDCDNRFNANMQANCKKHFYGHTRGRGAIAAANKAGFEACKLAAGAFYKFVVHGAEAMYNPSSHGPCAAVPR